MLFERNFDSFTSSIGISKSRWIKKIEFFFSKISSLIYFRFKDESSKSNPGDDYDADRYDVTWNGIVGDLVSGAAHLSFAPLSVSSARSGVIDFSAPYYFTGVSFLAAPQQKSEIPLMAFLLPFSPELWIAIFTSKFQIY